MVTQFEVHAPQASIHMKGRWSEGSSYDQEKDSTGILQDLSKGSN